jgi:hypothetical protein
MPKSNFAQSVLVNDPTTVINTLPDYTSHNGQGLWSQIRTANNSIRDPYADLYARIDKLELNEKLLRLKILGLEGKFDKDEVVNIRKMIMSEDEGARTLADSIIQNA